MAGIYRQIQDDVIPLWTTAWGAHPTVPAYWRANDAEVLPDPITTPYFFRNEVEFGRESVIGYGGGLGRNLRAQFGSVILHSFVGRHVQSEATALDLLADAAAAYRSKSITDALSNQLSFLGDGSGFDIGPVDDGNWFVRGLLIVFEYRFTG